MATDRTPLPDDASYGELLGEYVSVVADVSRLLDGFGRPPPEAMERYHRLRARKSALRERLADAESDGDRDGYRALIDRAAEAAYSSSRR